MNVNTILNLKGRDIVSASPSDLIGDLTKTFAEKKIGSILILKDGAVKGIVSERDVVKAIGQRGAEILHQPASRIMTKNVISCQGSDTIDKIMGVMTSGRFRHVPVVENDQLIGIISIGDVVQQRIAEAELEASSMRSYIATG